MCIACRFWRIVAVGLSVIIVSTAQARYSGGSGEPNDPYQIATAADLIALGNEPNDYDKHFILTADIDLDPNLPGGRVFDAAVIAPDIDASETGFQGSPFLGVLDGNRHVIRRLHVAGGSYLGLFGQIESKARIRNLGVVDVNVTGSGDYIGALAGYSRGDIAMSQATGLISGGKRVGGFTGRSWGDITASYSTATVVASEYAGGLAGGNYGSIVTCYSAGVVTANRDAGGLIGENYASISASYSTSRVDGNTSPGGLVGHNGQDANVTSSFWDTETSGQSASAGGTSRTTAQMQAAETFLDAGWDFVVETTHGTQDIWWINEGKGYPKLWWEGPAGMVFANVPAGTFEMGDHDGVGYMYERPVHRVTLRGFQISTCETTNAQYTAYLNAAMAAGLIQVVDGVVYASSDAALAQPYCDTYSSSASSQIEYDEGRFTVRARESKDMSNHPMIMVSWYGAKAFCDYYGCRLPTEAQWEYAAQGGYHDPYYQYPWGTSAIDCSKANYNNCNPSTLKTRPFTSPVGYYGPQGAYGLCDMAGNVWEWCQDWFTSTYYSASPANEPTGPATGAHRMLRGGAWNYDAKACRVPRRYWNLPGDRNFGYGFRVCR